MIKFFKNNLKKYIKLILIIPNTGKARLVIFYL